MRKLGMLLLIAATLVVSACSQAAAEKDDRFVLVEGGSPANTKSNHYGKGLTIASFYIGKYEVTQREWTAVMGGNPSAFVDGDRPVEMVSWYDAVAYCNRLSELEGYEPYYTIDMDNQDPDNKSEYDPVKWTVTINPDANGYRLPTEAEWEYASGGGQKSKRFTYSGSNEPDEVAWYWRNAGDEYLEGDWNWPAIENNKNRTQPVGSKQPNELGLYDMSGNVREWCWDWYEDEEADIASGLFRVVKGGGWIGDVSNGASHHRGKFEASGFGPDQGFRIVRSA